MAASHPPFLALAALLAALAAALGGCANSVSTSSFKGEQHEAAQAIADFQSDSTSGDEHKICTRDVSAAVVTRLGGLKACEKAIKDQLGQVDNLEVSVSSVQIAAGGTKATAQVKSVRGGKHRTSTVTLVKEGGRWKVSTLA